MNFTIQRIFTMTAVDLLTDATIFKSEFLKTANLANEEETVYSMGGVGNPYINGDSHSKRTTMTTDAATFDMKQLALITGTSPVVGATTIRIDETLVINTNASATSKTAISPSGGTADEILSLHVLDASGNIVDTLTQTAVAASGSFAYDSATKALTFFASEFEDGTKILVSYDATTDANATTVSNNTDEFGGTYKFVFDSLVQDTCSNVYEAQLVIYKGKVNGTWSFDLAADGEPAVLSMEITALKSCESTKLWDLIVYDMDEVS
jgi:hypothetical protein